MTSKRSKCYLFRNPLQKAEPLHVDDRFKGISHVLITYKINEWIRSGRNKRHCQTPREQNGV